MPLILVLAVIPLIIAFFVFPSKQRRIRNSWTLTTARIIGRPERNYDTSIRGFFFGSIGPTEIEYITNEGFVRGQCYIPCGVTGGEGGLGEVEWNMFWELAYGVSVPVYYNPESPEEVVFIGSIYQVHFDVVVKDGKMYDWISIVVGVAILMWFVIVFLSAT